MTTSADATAEKKLEEVIDALKNKDRDKARALFSTQALKDADDIENGIDYLFELVQGEIVEVGKLTWGTSESVEYGKVESKINAWCEFTTTEAEYYLYMLIFDEDDYNRKNIGLYSLRVVLMDDNYPKHVTYVQDMREPGIYAPSEEDLIRITTLNTDEYSRFFIKACEGVNIMQVRDYFSYEAVRDSDWFNLDYASVLYSEGAMFAIADVGMYPEYKTNGRSTMKGNDGDHAIESLYVEEHAYALLYDPENKPADAIIETFAGMNILDDYASWDRETLLYSYYGDLQDFYFSLGSDIELMEYEIMSLPGENSQEKALLYIHRNDHLIAGYPIEVSASELFNLKLLCREYEIENWQIRYETNITADGSTFSLAMQYQGIYFQSSGWGGNFKSFPDNFDSFQAEISEFFERLQTKYVA
jgi:hypothetical protein